MEIRNISPGRGGAARRHQNPRPELHLVALCWDGGSRSLLALGPRLGEVGWEKSAARVVVMMVMVMVMMMLGGAEVVVGDCPCR